MFVSARIRRLRGNALIEENGCSLIEINNAAYKPFKLALRGYLSKSCSTLHLFLREQPLIKICALIMNRSGILKQTF
ncbi:MAG TPA: hypothetical protein DEO86_21685 [Colwellia sp.]|jgi:hypothetical protein|nr:hypothetical protein [Colwellia sp.]